MSHITLFDLAAQIRAEVETIDTETGEISQAYTDNRELFERDKVVACVAYCKDDAGRIASAIDMLAAMQQQIKTRETRVSADLRYYAGFNTDQSEWGRQLWSFAAMPKIWAEKIEEGNAI